MRKVLFILLCVLAVPCLGQIPFQLTVYNWSEEKPAVRGGLVVQVNDAEVVCYPIESQADSLVFHGMLPDTGTCQLSVGWAFGGRNPDTAADQACQVGKEFQVSERFPVTGEEDRLELALSYVVLPDSVVSNFFISRIVPAPDSMFRLVSLWEPGLRKKPRYRIVNQSDFDIMGYHQRDFFWGTLYRAAVSESGDSNWVKQHLGEWVRPWFNGSMLRAGDSTACNMPYPKKRDGRIRKRGHYEYRVYVKVYDGHGMRCGMNLGMSKHGSIYELIHAFDVE